MFDNDQLTASSAVINKMGGGGGGGGGGIPLCSAFIIHVFDYFTNFCVCSQPINIKTISLHLETVCMFSPFKKKTCLFVLLL